VNSLPKTVTRQRCDCDLNPGPSAPESSMLPGVVFVMFQGCGLGLETLSRCNNVSSRTNTSRRLVSVSGYFMSLVQTFCAAYAQCGAVYSSSSHTDQFALVRN